MLAIGGTSFVVPSMCQNRLPFRYSAAPLCSGSERDLLRVVGLEPRKDDHAVAIEQAEDLLGLRGRKTARGVDAVYLDADARLDRLV
jgi:hypothetical protein